MYVSIHDQHSCKILQNELKLLMSYQQQGVWARFLARPVRIDGRSEMRIMRPPICESRVINDLCQ